jgi:hypothetical protein
MSCLKYLTSVRRITISDIRGFREAIWDWRILVHVCQRWRQVVFGSPLRLNLRILCTYGTPVRKHLDIWPTFPIHIEYIRDKPMERNDEDNVIAALDHLIVSVLSALG